MHEIVVRLQKSINSVVFGGQDGEILMGQLEKLGLNHYSEYHPNLLLHMARVEEYKTGRLFKLKIARTIPTILLIEEIRHQLISYGTVNILSFTGVIHVSWCRISSINSRNSFVHPSRNQPPATSNLGTAQHVQDTIASQPWEAFPKCRTKGSWEKHATSKCTIYIYIYTYYDNEAPRSWFPPLTMILPDIQLVPSN